MKVGAGLSTLSDPREAAIEATATACGGLDGERPDLALVFASPHHAAEARAVLDAVHERANPRGVIGCVAEAVVGGAREVEREPALSVWLGALPGGAETFHMEFLPTDGGGAFAGWVVDARGQPDGTVLLVCDPFTFPADLFLQHLNERIPGTPVVGGMASGGIEPGQTVLFHDREVLRSGAVGARLPGAVSVQTLVSQGCRPIGQSLVVTRAEDNVLFELGGRPPLERLKETVNALASPDRDLLSRGLHLGRVIDEYKTEYGTGDFLIRGVVGADPDSGAIAVGDHLEVGQTVQFHVRDAATADEELRTLLEDSASARSGSAAGALLFTCNGRGSRLFTTPDHDARMVSSYLEGAPVAGFFCAGELGPVGGKNFLHGFTASVVVFVDRATSTANR
ncbi:MAG TPA: FIST N-terminal domain-containing protein [Actinomycetota bacterium]